jgi:hypothetical protein
MKEGMLKRKNERVCVRKDRERKRERDDCERCNREKKGLRKSMCV